MIGKTIAHYEILDKLGAGGMGQVYRARDRKLRRDVALKMLPPEVARDPERVQRLTQEARAVASLNHPNIVTVYAIEESDGLHFLTMEYVQGKSLDQVIPAGGLPRERLLALALPLAEALAAAHAVGVVHRDLKPANVVLGNDGRAKILDFGLAKFLAASEAADGPVETATMSVLTQEGMVMGTVPYMSPEQLQGEPVDARSDVYSFGVMLFEMATGQRPFQAKSQAGLVSAILKDPTPSVTDLRSDVPSSLQRVVSRCLAKNPTGRFQAAQDVYNELVALRTESTRGASAGVSRSAPATRAGSLRSPTIRVLAGLAVVLLAVAGGSQVRSGCTTSTAQGAVAVLPFVNTSEDPDTEYLSDGVTESLINRLSQLSNLKVMSHHSVSRFKEGDLDPQAIGRQLGVSSVLMGHVDSRGDKLIVGVELLSVEDGTQLWGDRFDRDKTDILTIERDIVTRISERLRVRLSGAESEQLARVDSVDPEAYSLYLRGRYFLMGTSVDGPERAQEFFRQALEIEPRFALAYTGLGDCYVTRAWLNSAAREEMVPKARAALAKAMEIDEGLCEAHVLAGQVKMYFEWDWAGAEAEFLRAIELKPGSDLAHREYSSFLGLVSRVDESIEEARKAQALDPLSVYATHQLAYNLMCAERYEEAVVEFKKAIELNPTWIWGNIKLGMAYALMGDHTNAELAKTRADELLDGRPGSQLAQQWLAAIELRAGKPQRMRVSLARLQEQSKGSYVDPTALALFHHDLGEYEQAFEMLERGYEIRSPLMAYLLLNENAMFKEIGADPRYQDLLLRMAFPRAPS
jgi:serine/threonine-protein kinase